MLQFRTDRHVGRRGKRGREGGRGAEEGREGEREDAAVGGDGRRRRGWRGGGKDERAPEEWEGRKRGDEAGLSKGERETTKKKSEGRVRERW